MKTKTSKEFRELLVLLEALLVRVEALEALAHAPVSIPIQDIQDRLTRVETKLL